MGKICSTMMETVCTRMSWLIMSTHWAKELISLEVEIYLLSSIFGVVKAIIITLPPAPNLYVTILLTKVNNSNVVTRWFMD